MDLTRVMALLRPGENVAPDLSSYAAMAAGWRGSGDIPAEADCWAVWAELSAAASPGFDGVDDLEAAQAVAHALIVAEFEKRAAPLAAGRWGGFERETFQSQLEEARAYTADSGADTPFLDAIVAVSGEAKADLATAVLANAAALQTAMAGLLGVKRAKLAAMYALETVADVKSYDPAAGWPA